MTQDDKNPKIEEQIMVDNQANSTKWEYNIKLLNHEWKEEWSFSVSEEDIERYSILELAENKWLNIWYSCRSGACVSCSCKVISWQDNIDIGKMEIPLIDVDQGDILTCCAGLKNTKWQIVIQKKY